MEVNGGFEILDIPEAFRSSLDGHDLTVQALGHPVGDRVLAVGQNILQPLMDHGTDPFDWFQLATGPPISSMRHKNVWPRQRFCSSIAPEAFP
jgi:hypothetical protein